MKQYKPAMCAAILTAFLALSSPFSAHAAELDGGTIANSGSTNTSPYTIKIWSDGHGIVAVPRAADKPFSVSAAVASRFFTDVKSARSNPGTPGRCMKSASFGTRTTVSWHGWNSTDLQCPPFSPAVSLLAHDVTLIQQAANVAFPMRRVRLPIDQRQNPASPSATPSMTPQPESGSPRS